MYLNNSHAKTFLKMSILGLALFNWSIALGHTGKMSREVEKMEDFLGHFVEIKGGMFMMGSPQIEENRDQHNAQHLVILSDFELGEAAITQETYTRVMGVNPSPFNERRDCPQSFKQLSVGGRNIPVCADHPVVNVSWNDADRFIQRVNNLFKDSGYRFLLPTEAQFEYAIRGGTTTAYVSGESAAGLGEYVWYSANSNCQYHPVKSKRANAYGIYRSSVWEWVNDWYAEFGTGTQENPLGPPSSFFRVVRGGSSSLGASASRSDCRNWSAPDSWGDGLGFRLARVRQ